MNSSNDPIVIDSDTEDEDEVPQQQRSAKRRKTQNQQPHDDDDDDIVEVTGNPAATPYQIEPSPTISTVSDRTHGLGGLNSLDRVALERARRERQKQRRRDAGLPSDDEAESNNSSSSNEPLALRRISATDRFWHGSVKRSFNRYIGDGVPFSDFILPTTKSNAAGLQAAIVSSFDWDFAWLQEMLPTAGAGQTGPHITLVMKERDGLPAGLHQMKARAAATSAASDRAGWTVLAVKSRAGEYSTMHIKMLLLLYGDRLRLVISTGNLNKIDWDSLENAAWVQDFPLRSSSANTLASSSSASFPSFPSSSKQAQDVETQLVAVLDGLDVPAAHPVRRALPLFDFSVGPTIIASIPRGSPYVGADDVRRFGLGRLAEKAREALGEDAAVAVEAQGSSMGTYSQRWLQQFHLVASGKASPSSSSPTILPDGGKKNTEAYIKATVRHDTTDRANVLRRYDNTDEEAWPPIHILFPTHRFVAEESKGRAAGGGCHFGKPDAFRKWKQLCFDVRAERDEGVLMHQKAVLVLKKGSEADEGGRTIGSSSSKGDGDSDSGEAKSEKDCVGYVVMTSANFGQAAWGNLSMKKDNIQLSLNNWELGVLLPVKRSDLRPSARLSTNARSAICWTRPARQYGDGDVPWAPPLRTAQ